MFTAPLLILALSPSIWGSLSPVANKEVGEGKAGICAPEVIFSTFQ
jgi:hypothetical protein